MDISVSLTISSKILNMKGSSQDTWHPVMNANTTIASYWLNWRFFLCAIWVLISITTALVLIWRKEDCPRNGVGGRAGESKKEETDSCLYDDETWRPCFKGIHPAWLLIFRVCAFLVLLVMLTVAVFVDGGSIFYYYTQWTITSVAVYFGLGSLLSTHGCYQYHKRVGGDKVDSIEADAEKGEYATPAVGESSNVSRVMTNSDFQEKHDVRQNGGKWAYVFQIIFQMNAGAVMLTDCVFWFILVPFLAIRDYHINALVVGMHTINAIFLLGDTFLNCLPFPWFRIAYFFMWTTLYVIFQWIVHASARIWWPYPFLDLSSPYAPLWYFAVAVMHIPCYGIFTLIVKLKHTVFSRWFPQSYRGLR